MNLYMKEREEALREMRELAHVCPDVTSTDCYKTAMEILEVPEIKFTFTWNYEGVWDNNSYIWDDNLYKGISYVFKTSKALNTHEVTDGNQDETSDFRLDVPNEGPVVVYTIGDSSENGFLVCEECTYMFDMEWLVEKALASNPINIQAAYEEFQASYDY